MSAMLSLLTHLEQLWVHQWQLDHLSQLSDLIS
jgi:hypothetical protein